MTMESKFNSLATYLLFNMHFDVNRVCGHTIEVPMYKRT